MQYYLLSKIVFIVYFEVSSFNSTNSLIICIKFPYTLTYLLQISDNEKIVNINLKLRFKGNNHKRFIISDDLDQFKFDVYLYIKEIVCICKDNGVFFDPDGVTNINEDLE